MPAKPDRPAAARAPSASPAAAAPDIATASVAEALALLRTDAAAGLAQAEVDARRKVHGFNEVAEQPEHPLRRFLAKFWGVSAWMLELIMVLSAVLGKVADLAVVGALLVVNAVLGFAQEHRAAGVVQALRRRLQVNARVLPRRALAAGAGARARPRRHRPRARRATSCRPTSSSSTAR